MKPRDVVIRLALVILLATSFWLGVKRIIGFLYRYRGEEALSHARMDEAYTNLVASLKWQPLDSPSYVLIGRVIHLAQSNSVPIKPLAGKSPEQVFAEGVGAIAWGISLNPSDGWAWFNLAEAYRAYGLKKTRLDRLRAMVEAAKAKAAGKEAPATPSGEEPAAFTGEDVVIVAADLKAMQLEPQSSFYHDFLSLLYWDRGLKDDAAREIREGFSLTPQSAAHPWLSNREFTAGLLQPILEGIDRSRSSRFVDPLAPLLARGEVFEAAGHLDDALEAYQELQKEGGPGVETECDLRIARLQQRLGYWPESVRLLQRILELEPDSPRATLALNLLGIACSNLGEHEQAVQYLRRYTTRAVASTPVLLSLAGELEQTGGDLEAEKIYTAVIQRDPGSSLAWTRLIQLLRRHRRRVEALSWAQRFEAEMPDNDTAHRLVVELSHPDDEP
ncbi:MAG TPA: tetratricopeptide repeat protein [Candidatus Saccharimonadales bacterium]|nr:tetratricopeptide repeat protein [Candidatus Saccharimonadales bacterium]